MDKIDLDILETFRAVVVANDAGYTSKAVADMSVQRLANCLEVWNTREASGRGTAALKRGWLRRHKASHEF